MISVVSLVIYIPLLPLYSTSPTSLRTHCVQSSSTYKPVLVSLTCLPTGRLVRLIPDDGDPDSEAAAIKALFNHRLPKDSRDAKHEWQEILEAEHSVWNGVSTPKKELIRSHLNWVNLEIVKRVRPSSRFDFSGASMGNLFLTG